MEPIVEFMEHPDYEAYRRFYLFAENFRPIAWANRISIYGVIPAFFAYVVINDLRRGNLIYYTLICFVLIAALLVYYFTAPRRAFKRQSSSFVTSRAAFFEDYYAVVITGQNSTQEGSFAYGDIMKIYETTSAFYVRHINKNWGFFPKKFFAPGQVEALRALFARKFGEQFISKI